jgi:hypothetical protein
MNEPIIFEIIPPPVTWDQAKIEEYADQVAFTLTESGISLIAIPEVINESREGERKTDFVNKMDNILFSDLLKKRMPQLESILFKISVRLPKNEFEAWIDIVYQKGIRYVTIVGGESGMINYQGYSVKDAIRYITKKYPSIHVGAITIFTRPDEPERIIEKIKAGAGFFFSQIIFEAANMKQVALNLSKLCKKDNIPFPMIYLSLALASKPRDIEFMKWLGVEFPSAVFAYLTSDREEEVEQRTLETVKTTLDEIQHFSEKEHLEVGYNIEHLMFGHLHLSAKLCKQIKLMLGEQT